MAEGFAGVNIYFLQSFAARRNLWPDEKNSDQKTQMRLVRKAILPDSPLNREILLRCLQFC